MLWCVWKKKKKNIVDNKKKKDTFRYLPETQDDINVLLEQMNIVT